LCIRSAAGGGATIVAASPCAHIAPKQDDAKSKPRFGGMRTPLYVPDRARDCYGLIGLNGLIDRVMSYSPLALADPGSEPMNAGGEAMHDSAGKGEIK
jgi:hypothetical protein